MILGFTGTHRVPLPEAQQRALVAYLIKDLPTTVLHGGAPGSDEMFHDLLAELAPETIVEIYPGSADRYRYWHRRHPLGLHYSQPPLVRDKLIARRCDRLLGCPAQVEEIIRSGTWATVRYARAAHKPITLILPDGSVREETP